MLAPEMGTCVDTVELLVEEIAGLEQAADLRGLLACLCSEPLAS